MSGVLLAFGVLAIISGLATMAGGHIGVGLGYLGIGLIVVLVSIFLRKRAPKGVSDDTDQPEPTPPAEQPGSVTAPKCGLCSGTGSIRVWPSPRTPCPRCGGSGKSPSAG